MSLVQTNAALTVSEAKKMIHMGFILKLLAIGTGKDYYDVYTL